MVARKRGRVEMEESEPAEEPSLLIRLRNMWEFANLMQYIFFFGKAVKIDEDFDIEDLETDCLKTGPSEKLNEIGLALLKFVSSHRGLTPGIFDEFTRRQYLAKAPSCNPFGSEEEPAKFADFDIFTKIRVLFQLSQWTLVNPDRIRERMPESKDTEQTTWRIEEIGYDRNECLYFVLDDNRLYRRTDPPPPPSPAVKPKANSKKGKAAARASKRRKVIESDDSAQNTEHDEGLEQESKKQPEEDGMGGRKWECIAITLDEYQTFLEGIKKTKDPNEKALFKRLSADVLPIIEKAAEEQARKVARRERELLTLQKLSTAKRSSRIQSKMDREKEDQEAAESERKRQADLVAARKDQEKQKQMEEARESRMLTREQRLKEREYKRILHEEELANLSEDNKKLETGEARMSERHLKAEIEKRKKELEKLAEEDSWVFDCSKCGVHGENIDDGAHSVACEKCSIWQHSSCLGISEIEAEKENFHFVCQDCIRREEDAKKPKIPALKFRLGSSSSPPSDKTVQTNGLASPSKRHHEADEPSQLPPTKKFKHVGAPHTMPEARQISNDTLMHQKVMNGPRLSPQGQSPSIQPPPLGNGYSTQGTSNPTSYTSPQLDAQGIVSPRQHGPATNGYRHETQTYSPPHSSYQPQMSAQANAWSDMHPAPRTSYQSQNQHIARPPPPEQNPFNNTFDRQQPKFSQPSKDLPSPMHNRPSMSPTQGNRDVGQLAYPQGMAPNGGISPHKSPNTYTSPTVHPRVLSSPLGLPSSSPVMAPPLSVHHQSTSGLSPSKHSPPRPTSSHSVSNTPIMPPAANLSPSPQKLNLHAPVKGMTPEQLKTKYISPHEQINGTGHTNGQGRQQ